MVADFRNYLLPPDHPRVAGLGHLDAVSFTDAAYDVPFIGDVLRGWRKSFLEDSFRGVTSDGSAIPGLFEPGADEGAAVARAVGAANDLLSKLSPQARDQLSHPLDSRVWRAWFNPEFYINRYGLRLEEQDPAIRELALRVIEASLSEKGYGLIRNVMRTNEFLGDLVGLPKIMNESSYNINLFGTPSAEAPWGWNFYGHHLCLNCLFIGNQQVFTPIFLGAEPNEIDEGEYAGTVIFSEQEQAGLAFMESLPAELAEQAILYRSTRDPDMPEGRVVPGDELHLGGAFHDNRVIPYEGLPIGQCTAQQQNSLVELVELFLSYQPDGPRAARLTEVRRRLDQTWFCWIGGTRAPEPFYFRIQSPVIFIEFDHHAGIYLANTEPERFHIHIIVRTPNGNDYGAELVRRATGTAHTLEALP